MSKTQSSKRIVYLATQNQHKLEELAAMLGDSWSVRPAFELGDISWDETGTTFEANAKIKALAVKEHTGACVLADDSGLEVEALDGKPGIYSSRFAGTESSDADNNTKLISDLKAIESLPSAARFVCCLYLIDEKGAESSFEGFCEGMIIENPRGEHGFGYDPHFMIPSLNKSLAELSADEKNEISHRRMAIRKFLSDLSKQATS